MSESAAIACNVDIIHSSAQIGTSLPHAPCKPHGISRVCTKNPSGETSSALACIIHLVVELSVLVLAEECRTDSRQCVVLEQSETFLKCVVDIDLTASSNNADTSSTVTMSVIAPIPLEQLDSPSLWQVLVLINCDLNILA